MGIIAKEIEELEPKYNRLVKLADKVNTSALQRELLAKVFDCFSALRPLSYNYKEVGEAEVSYYGYYTYARLHKRTIAIGSWINTKYGYQEYGRGIYDHSVFFELVEKKGLEYTDHLRRPIRKDWETLVKLMRKLQSFNEATVKLSFVEPIEVVDYSLRYYPSSSSINSMEIHKMRVKGLALETKKPSEFYLTTLQKNKVKKVRKILRDDSNIAILEDVIDDLLALYRKAEKQISKIRRHNEPIVKQMEAIAKVWQISKSLKKSRS